MRTVNFLLCFIFWFCNQAVNASCLPPSSNLETFEILACEEVNLKSLNPPPNWAGLQSYQGVILQINTRLVERTRFRKDQQSPVQNLSKKTQVFFQTTGKKPCMALAQGTKWTGIKTEACCDGDPNSPCLLSFSSYVYDLKKISLVRL